MAGIRSRRGPEAGTASLREPEEDAVAGPERVLNTPVIAVVGSRGDRPPSGDAAQIPRPRRTPTSAPGRPGPLTGRDRELIGLLADARSTAQIAAALSVSGNTARTRIR